MSVETLLSDSDGPAFELVNEHGRSSAVLVVDHASHTIPERLGDLGLGEADRLSHIGWDIGAAVVARHLSRMLDAPLLLSGFSRLVIDCNRPLGAASSIPKTSCGVVIPGNESVDEHHARLRAEACFLPYHREVTRLLDARKAKNERTVVLAIHSYTPVMDGFVRPWHASVLYGRDTAYAARWLEELRRDPKLVIGDNEPYRVTDGGDSTIPVHAEKRGLHGVLIETRQDIVGVPEGALEWAERLATAFRAVDASFER